MNQEPTTPAPRRRPWAEQPRAWAVGAFVAGAVLGGGSILIPGLHLLATWACPVAGSVVALWLWSLAPGPRGD